MSEDAHFHHWELGFKQSGLRHITRALRGSTLNAFTALHAFPPCCCPLALSRPGEVGDPEASSFRTSTLCESDPTPSETAQLRPAAGFPDLHGGSSRPRLLRGLRPARRPQRTTHLPVPVLAARDEGNAGQFPRSPPDLSTGLGVQLCSCGIATTTPWTFTVASYRKESSRPGVPDRLSPSGAHRNPAHIRQI